MIKTGVVVAGCWVVAGVLAGVSAGTPGACVGVGGGVVGGVVDEPSARGPEEIPGFWMERYTTTDRFGRAITFYVSKAKEGAEKLPLVVCIAGSGCQSLFVEVETPQGKRIATGGPESAIRKALGDKVRLLVVEKPGVKFLDKAERPGSAEGSSEEFRREHTLERWSEAVGAAVRAGVTLPGVDGSRVLVLGHSEGGITACKVAADNACVTHVAVMAGGGPTQLYDLIELARQGKMGPPGEGEQWIMEGWKSVMADPESTTLFFMGHPNRRWSTFCASSPVEEIVKSKAKVFIAQGTADIAVLPATADVLYAELLARGRDVKYEKVEGGDHGFMKASDPDPRAGWLEMNRKAVEWFLGG